MPGKYSKIPKKSLTSILNYVIIISTLEKMSQVSKDLYNQVLFEEKAHYAETGEILIMKAKTNLEGNINYRLLPAKVAQQTLMLVEQNIKSFFSASADYKEHPQKYQARPHFPRFLPKDGHFVLVFTNQQAKITEYGDYFKGIILVLLLLGLGLGILKK